MILCWKIPMEYFFLAGRIKTPFDEKIQYNELEAIYREDYP
jgi:hypothetical protein